MRDPTTQRYATIFLQLKEGNVRLTMGYCTDISEKTVIEDIESPNLHLSFR